MDFRFDVVFKKSQTYDMNLVLVLLAQDRFGGGFAGISRTMHQNLGDCRLNLLPVDPCLLHDVYQDYVLVSSSSISFMFVSMLSC